MKQAIYTAVAMLIAFAAFAGVASAQAYYPGYQQVSWRPTLYYQNYGYGAYGQYASPPVFQPSGICITCGGYGSWGGINTGTGFGTWGGNYTYLTGNSYYPAQGYYPNGYSLTIRNRNVWNDGDDRVIRNRVRTETFIPF